MCGRYFIEISDEELQEIANAVEKSKPEYEQLTFKTNGEIFPTDTVPVQTGVNSYQLMKWGFVSFDGKPIINARSETALQKPMFKAPMSNQRCLIPASGYYEWKKEGTKKIKHQFFIPGTPIYLAGCWRQEKNSPLHTFVILTRQAVGGAEAIHERMPVIIPRQHIGTWLNDSSEVMAQSITDLSIMQVS